VKLPSLRSVAFLLLLALYVLIVVARWGYKAANQGGFPFLSIQTLEAIWPWVAALVVSFIVVGIGARSSK